MFGAPFKEMYPDDTGSDATEPPANYGICTETTDRSEWSPKVAAFYEYWLRLKKPGLLPGRQDFDPLDIPALLPNIWLFNVHSDPIRFQVRLLGTKLVESYGADPTGRWLHEAHRFSPNIDQVLRRFERVVRDRVVIYSQSLVQSFQDKDHLRVENVTLPLARDGKKVDMLAGLSWIHHRRY